MDHSIERHLPREIESSLRRWGKESATLQAIYILLGIVAIVAPLIVASFTDLLGILATRITSFVGAMAVGLIGGFHLAAKANDPRQAYLELREAVIRYRADPSITEMELIKTFSTIAASRRVGTVDGPGTDQSK